MERERIENGAIARPDSLRARIHRELRDRLQRGEIRIGQRLVDTEIAAGLGVSRMPVREALLQLVHEGYLVGTTRGFALPNLTLQDIADIFEVRRLLEPRAAANAARDLTPAGEKQLRHCLELARRAHRDNDVELLMQANALFRQTWLGAVRNDRLASTISRFVDHVQTVRSGTLHDRATQAVAVEGLEKLYDAFARRDPVSAQDRMAHFIAQAEEAFFAVRRAREAAGEEAGPPQGAAGRAQQVGS